jgi:hypothetical protein
MSGACGESHDLFTRPLRHATTVQSSTHSVKYEVKAVRREVKSVVVFRPVGNFPFSARTMEIPCTVTGTFRESPA